MAAHLAYPLLASHHPLGVPNDRFLRQNYGVCLPHGEKCVYSVAEFRLRQIDRFAVPALNLMDYETAYAGFSWNATRRDLDGLPAGGGLNIAHETVDRHAQGPRRNHVALRWLDRNAHPHDYTYLELQRLTNRFANVLRKLNIHKGDCVCSLTERIPALYVAALGTLKVGAVYCPLFSAYGPEPVRIRLAKSRAKLLLTTQSLYHRKVAGLLDALPDLDHILVIPEGDLSITRSGIHDFDALLEGSDDDFTIGPTALEDAALLHFTSGTTGSPKAALHVHAAIIAHHATAKLALDLRPDDLFWCTADPGWVTGITYGMIAPLSLGATLLFDQEEFAGSRWYQILQDHRINVWYTSPTAVRMLMRLGANTARHYDMSHLRFMATVGEPLNPQAVRWGLEALGRPFHDTWWQTETGAIMIANTSALDLKAGSMGRPVPGIDAAIVQRRRGGGIQRLDRPNAVGELALRAGWPSMFRGYLGDMERYRQCFASGWYLSGDLVKEDEDGYLWFVARSDDVIKSSGHLIGPFEVENALMEHAAVAEVGVIGKPDPIALELVKAFVALNEGYRPGPQLRRELLAHARDRLGAAVAPKELEFRDNLPKTRSGKIMRRLLKAQELGLPEGDLSMLEEHSPRGPPTGEPQDA
jgi:acetyl-CoA synthetase